MSRAEKTMYSVLTMLGKTPIVPKMGLLADVKKGMDIAGSPLCIIVPIRNAASAMTEADNKKIIPYAAASGGRRFGSIEAVPFARSAFIVSAALF
jgi:hypothetical protein